MMRVTFKIFYKILRLFKLRGFYKIKAGPVKGYLWNVLVEDSRYILGEYEPRLANLVKSEVQSGKRFIDIGSNAGYFSMVAFHFNLKGSKMLSIEPIPQNLALQKEHFEKNSIKNIEILPFAISNINGTIEFSNTSNLAANTYKKESSAFVGEKISVKTKTLDEIATDYQLDSNCFIKIDVEGAEFDVLEGGKNYLTKDSPHIMLATHDCHVPGVKDECLKLLKSYGYNYREIEDEKISGQMDYFVFK